MTLRRLDIDEIGKPMRVAIVHRRDDATVGGSLRVGETIANNLDPRKVEAHLVFAYGGPGHVASRARVPCHFIESKGPKDFSGWKRFRKLIRDLDCDAIHNVDGVVWAHLASLNLNVHRIIHIHDKYKPVPPLNDRFTLRLLRMNADATIFISNGARKDHIRRGGVKPEKSYVVYNGIDLTRYGPGPDKSECRRKLGIPTDVKLMGMVCRLTAEKGCLDFLRVLSRLPDKWHGVFTNDGPFRGEIMKFARLNNLEQRIHMLGVLDDVKIVYSALDALGLFTYYEAFGLVMAEAMVSGVPVFGLGSDGEYREPEFPLITKQNSIFVERVRPHNYYDSEDPQVLNELAAKIADYGEHPERYQEQIEHARVWVKTRFDAQIQAEATTRVYKHVCFSHESNAFPSSVPYEIKPMVTSF
jgi:glycosyltransferase involved in cell wall biosynthesis